MSYEYSENILVQESAGYLLSEELGWRVELAYKNEKVGDKVSTYGRVSKKEVFLKRYFRDALKRLNPWISETQIDEAEKKLLNHISTSSLLQINEEKYFLIRDGIPVTVKKPDGRTVETRAKVIDFQNIENNDFLALKEFQIDSPIYTYHRRTDIVGFVNGIPLLFIELKRNDKDVENAYTDNYSDYLDTIPQLFYCNAFIMLSNGEEAKVGTLGSKYEFFSEWKRLKEEDAGSVELETMLRGICRKENFLDLFENFILFDHSGGKTVKILARNHQYLGVNEAVKAYENRKLNHGKLGVFWHTQGSGKSYSMLFLAQKIRRKFAGSPTIIVLTDRDELNRQISDTFENCGVLGKTKATQYIALSSTDLINKLHGNPSFIFTLIQKFNKSDVDPIVPDHDIIIMSDEAHRSQYGIFADNMMKLLPTASRIGFTGTPLLSDDNITERTFGEYVSIYDFNRAVEDGATVPLFYENRGEKILHLQNPGITDEMLDAIEDADLNGDEEEKLENEFKKEVHLLTAEPRLRRIAKDFVGHYSDLWTSGKAMFVCLNKVTCVRMYNFVQEYWQEEIKDIEGKLKTASQQEAQELERKLKWMKETEMAVVISEEQNELKTFKNWGLDITYHREKMAKRQLDKEFKDRDNPLRVVFVCAMWLTGFDVKCLSCLYLDKPLKAHTLMQTIARANRVDEGKENGLIIDYIGIVKALKKALADYTINITKGAGSDPTVDKDELIKKVIETESRAEKFLSAKGFKLEKLLNAKDFEVLSRLIEAENAVCESKESRKEFSPYASELFRLSKYLDRDDIDKAMRKRIDAILAIERQLNKKVRHADNSALMAQINRIISYYVKIEDQQEGIVPSKQFDISKIDFDLLSKEFERAKNKNLIIRDLDTVVKQRLDEMLKSNPKRIDYYEHYQKIIDDYNNTQDSAEIEKTFMDLMNLAKSMTTEEKRYVREGFENDEELSLYDMLFSDNLSKEDIRQLKKVSVDLYQKIQSKIQELDHWTDKPETKAVIDNLIRDTLWNELPASYDEFAISKSRQRIYDYFFQRSMMPVG